MTVVAVVVAGFAGIRAIDRGPRTALRRTTRRAGYADLQRTATIGTSGSASQSDLYLTRPTVECAGTFDCDPCPLLQLSDLRSGLNERRYAGRARLWRFRAFSRRGGAWSCSTVVSERGEHRTRPGRSDRPRLPVTDGACGPGRYFCAVHRGIPRAPSPSRLDGAGSERSGRRTSGASSVPRHVGRSRQEVGGRTTEAVGLRGRRRGKRRGSWRLEVAPGVGDTSVGDVDLQLVTPTGGSVIEGSRVARCADRAGRR